jgi:hypothetical protein
MFFFLVDEESGDVLVPFRVGAGQVAEDAAKSHPQGEDRLANVGAVLSGCRKQQLRHQHHY